MTWDHNLSLAPWASLQASSLSEEELATGVVSADTKIRHKYSQDGVPVTMTFVMGGTKDQRLLMVTMKRLAATQVSRLRVPPMDLWILMTDIANGVH